MKSAEKKIIRVILISLISAGLIIFSGLVIFFLYLTVYSKISDKEAVEAAYKFCRSFNVAITNTPSTSYSCPYWYLDLLTTGGKDYKERSIGDVCVSFMKQPGLKAYNLDRDVYVSVGSKSKETEIYVNLRLRFEFLNKYGFKSEGPHGQRISWSAFMSEEDANKIVRSIGSKMIIPEDMEFDRLEKDEKEGVWNAFWVRKKDGFRYEKDGMLISITGPSGEFLAFSKTYRGTPCPTEVKINEKEALELGWRVLLSHIPTKAKGKDKGLYEVKKPMLVIIQPRTLWESYWDVSLPFVVKKSRLAWVIQYRFTGGLTTVGADGEKSKSFLVERDRKWREMGLPPMVFEVRIDAATGEFLYTSPVAPSYLKWLVR